MILSTDVWHVWLQKYRRSFIFDNHSLDLYRTCWKPSNQSICLAIYQYFRKCSLNMQLWITWTFKLCTFSYVMYKKIKNPNSKISRTCVCVCMSVCVVTDNQANWSTSSAEYKNISTAGTFIGGRLRWHITRSSICSNCIIIWNKRLLPIYLLTQALTCKNARKYT